MGTRRIGKMGMFRVFVGLAALAVLSLPAAAPAAEMKHGSMPGMGAGTDMMKMGDKAFAGKLGPWTAEARIMDMKASMEASGMKARGTMAHSHHLSIAVTDPKTKSRVTEGKGSVTVISPDKKMVTTDMMVMEGHFGADIDMPKPGEYRLKVNIESGGMLGTENIRYMVK